jgi:transposase, IS30 family
MPRDAHPTADERGRIAELKADGASLRAIGRALGRAASTISRELRRNALDSGAYRPQVADGAYMLRRQRPAALETDLTLAGYVVARLTEGWTPGRIAGLSVPSVNSPKVGVRPSDWTDGAACD